MSDEFCPRQIIFELPGTPGVLVTATETGTGAIDFIVDVEGGSRPLRGPSHAAFPGGSTSVAQRPFELSLVHAGAAFDPLAPRFVIKLLARALAAAAA